MKCTKPIRLLNKKIRQKFPEGLEVPCGKCTACRIKKRQEWSARMMHELDSHEDAVFVTLTYEGEQYDYGSVEVTDLQKFLKRLRKNISPRKIRYFACGEYGEKNTQRPHYHLIIFGLSLKAEDQKIIRDSWSLGFVEIGIAEPASIRYTAQYIDKKFSGDLAHIEYETRNRKPPFRVSSLGIGKQFALQNKRQIEENGYIQIKGIKQAIPRYYLNLLGLDAEKFKEKATDSEIDTVEHYSGYSYTRDEAYHILQPDEVRMIEDGIRMAKLQTERNLSAKIALKTKKL